MNVLYGVEEWEQHNSDCDGAQMRAFSVSKTTHRLPTKIHRGGPSFFSLLPAASIGSKAKRTRGATAVIYSIVSHKLQSTAPLSESSTAGKTTLDAHHSGKKEGI